MLRSFEDFDQESGGTQSAGQGLLIALVFTCILVGSILMILLFSMGFKGALIIISQNLVISFFAIAVPVALAIAYIFNSSQPGQVVVVPSMPPEVALTKWLDELEHRDLTNRMQAVRELEKIAQENSELHWEIMKSLVAFVRARIPWPPIPKADEEGKPVTLPKPPTDVQAVLDLFGRRQWRDNEPVMLDLSNLDLRGADLWEKDLNRTNFNHCHFERAAMGYSLMRNALFNFAVLTGANMEGTKLERASMTAANLSHVNLEGASLRGAQLSNAFLQGADLTRARLERANFNQTDFADAIIDRSRMAGADFRGAKLQKANIVSGEFRDARFDVQTVFPEGFDPNENNMTDGKEKQVLEIPEDEWT